MAEKDSILVSTKKVLGLGEDYSPFDEDILTYINSTFADLHQLGVGPVNGFWVEDDEARWPEFLGPDVVLQGFVRTFTAHKVGLMFDPPANSFGIDAKQKLIAEAEWRILIHMEGVVRNGQ